MRNSPKGKYVTVDMDNPRALGICDASGFVFNRCDMIRQMQWIGNDLKWTGLYVGKPFADVPNEQARPPILPPDPVPILYARPPQGQQMTWSNNNLPIFSLIQTPFASLGSTEDGVQPYLNNSQTVLEFENFSWSSA
jgi:hypothetical protein